MLEIPPVDHERAIMHGHDSCKPVVLARGPLVAPDARRDSHQAGQS